MFFNSYNFLAFFIIVYSIYWLLKDKKNQQNIFLLIASYFFYSCWDWRFLFLLIFSTVLDYYTGHKIDKSNSKTAKKIWLWISISINLGFLGLFKYYNFFTENFILLLNSIGFQTNTHLINIILPVGISFYTFHGLSYVIDIYKGRIDSEKNIIDYSLFVSFFPLLVAGPIERATHLLPQIKNKRVFNYEQSILGLRQILWGLFKKIVIADNCASYSNMVFESPESYNSTTLALGAIMFAFQIYGDFSGYSDIALGTARLLGFDLLKNFNFPYFSRSISEFWRRWHISLSTWFKDYLYIPLGGSRGGISMKIRNTFIIFLVSGFWHGANWTFIVWGGLNALLMTPAILKNRNHLDNVATGKLFPTITEFLQMSTTFLLTTICWIFFRSESIQQAYTYISNMFTKVKLELPTDTPYLTLIVIIFFIIVEWMGRECNFAIEQIDRITNKTMRFVFYYVILLMIFLYATTGETFIYFQF